MRNFILVLTFFGLAVASACASLKDEQEAAPKPVVSRYETVCTAAGRGVLWRYDAVTNHLEVCGTDDKQVITWVAVTLTAPPQQQQGAPVQGQAPPKEGIKK